MAGEPLNLYQLFHIYIEYLLWNYILNLLQSVGITVIFINIHLASPTCCLFRTWSLFGNVAVISILSAVCENQIFAWHAVLLQKLKFLPDSPSSCNAFQARGKGVQFPMASFEYLIALICSGRTMALRSNQTLMEMSVRRTS